MAAKQAFTVSETSTSRAIGGGTHFNIRAVRMAGGRRFQSASLSVEDRKHLGILAREIQKFLIEQEGADA